MTVYFHNPFYSTHYGVNVFNKMTKRFNHKKYWYITEYLLKNNPDTGIFVDLDQNSFSCLFRSLQSRHIRRILTFLELYAWMLLNKINPFSTKVVFNIDKIGDNDILFFFSYANLDSDGRLEYIKGKKILQVFHLTHYMLNTAAIGRNAEHYNADFFVAESDLSKCAYFRKFFPYYNKEVYVLPYVFQERFQRTAGFEERKNKCLAMGTFEILTVNDRLKDFMDYFGTDTFHPMRKVIYQNRKQLDSLIDSSISFHNIEINPKTVEKRQNILIKLYYQLWNLVNVKQRKYFQFNNVQRYNQYRMFVVPEEVNGLPGIGFVEGMACGCAYIGINDDMYKDIGLKPGVHYIAYENDLESLKDVITYYQRHTQELQKVAEAGHTFVTDRLNGKKAAETFLHDLLELGREYGKNAHNSRDLHFKCSFVETRR